MKKRDMSAVKLLDEQTAAEVADYGKKRLLVGWFVSGIRGLKGG